MRKPPKTSASSRRPTFESASNLALRDYNRTPEGSSLAGSRLQSSPSRDENISEALKSGNLSQVLSSLQENKRVNTGDDVSLMERLVTGQKRKVIRRLKKDIY